jgi:hypothetical protein
MFSKFAVLDPPVPLFRVPDPDPEPFKMDFGAAVCLLTTSLNKKYKLFK